MAIDVTALAISVTSTGIKEASQALSGMAASAKAATDRIAALVAATKGLQDVTRTVGAANNALTSSGSKMSQTLLQQKRDMDMYNAAGREYSRAHAEAIRMNGEFDKSIKQSAGSIRSHNESMREAHGLARGLAGSLGALWVTYGNLAGMAVGLGIGASLRAIVVQGADVEHTLEGIRVRGQETVASINEMRDSLMKLGQGVYGPQQVANAFETLILAGLNAQQALVSINAALNLATVGGTSIEKSAQTLVSVGTAIGYTAEGFSRVGDVISKTAALSMSSVETLSEAFKSASSVSKLYGVSLEDIATGLGALSNLGIQGSAAGTALKNMYKELASEADKVQGTFKKMGMNSLSMKDAEGNFRPLLTVVGELDTALKKLSPSEEKLAIARISNERGMRMLVQVLDLYRTKLAEGGDALSQFNKEVTDSYGFMAMGAVQMAQTAKSQIDSMMNTLKTVFVKTFKDVEPEIILFTQNMKRAFSSKEFQAGILTIANAFASMALAIAENIPLITKFVALLLAVKVAIAIGTIIQATTTAMVALAVAMKAAAAGALTMTLAMPALIPLLVLAAAAWAAYKLASSEAVAEKSAAVAAAYSKSVIDGMIAEAEQLKKTTALIRGKMEAGAAAKKVEQDSMLQLMATKDQSALADARAETERARMANNLGRYREGLAAVARLELQAANNAKIAAGAQAALAREAKDNAEVIAAQAKIKNPRPESTNTLGGDPDRAKINDTYNAAMLTQMATIKSTKKDMQNFEDTQNALFKLGEIGKLQFLESVQAKQLELFNKAQAARQQQLDTARNKGSQSDMTRVSGDMAQAKDDFESKKIQNRLDGEIAVQKVVEDFTRQRVAQLEMEHQYAAAVMLKWENGNRAAYKAAEADALKYGKVLPIFSDRVKQLGETQKAALKDAFNKEDVRDFNIAAEATRNAMKGIQTASEGNGIAAMFQAAQNASAKYAADLPALREKMGKLTDPKDINEAQAELTRLAETQRKLWAGVGESISESLESAFGKGGKAVGDLLKIGVAYNNLENKTGESRVKAFGAAAGAAKGFFKEGTTGYKVMETAEKAFRLIELAGMAKSLAVNITNAAAKAAAYVPAVLMSFMASMGPWGMAAAGVAIAAVLGGAFSGGGSAPMSAEDRQKKAGTGSVLGDNDAKSESIANSLSILEKNSGLGLVHTGNMVQALQAIQNGIGTLSASVTQGKIGAASIKESGKESFLGKIKNGLIGGKTTVEDNGISFAQTALGNLANLKGQGYTDVKKDGGWFKSDKFKTINTDLSSQSTAQFAKIVQDMSESVATAANFLGLGGDAFTEKMKTFVVDLGTISIKGLSGDQIKAQFEAIFSKLGDDMAGFGVAGLNRFQKIGEGYFETLSRVANDLIQVKDVFAVLHQPLQATGMAAIEISQSLVGFAGSLENLTTGTKYFVENFLTEAERMAPITASVTKAMTELNMAEVVSVEQFKAKVMALDLTVEADQKLYASLIKLAPEFFTAAEYAVKLADGTETLTKAQQKALDISKKQRELDIRLMEAQGNTLQAISMRREDELAALTKLAPALAKTQAAISALEDAAANFATQRALELRLMEASGDTVGALGRKREDEVNALKKTNPEFVKYLTAIYAAEDATKAETKAKDEASKNLEAAYQSESKALQDVIDKFKKFSDTLKKFKQSLLMGDLSTLSPEQKYLKSKDTFIAQSAMAANGDEKALEGLQDVAQEFLDASRGYNASTEAYAKDFDLVQKALDKSIAAADKQADAASAQLKVMNDQYQALVGVKGAVLSFKDAFEAFAALKDKGGASANAITGAYKDALGRAPEAAGMDYWQGAVAKGTVDVAGAVGMIKDSPEAKVNAIYRKILGRESDVAGMQFWLKALSAGSATLGDIEASIVGSKEATEPKVDGSHFNGLDNVPFDNYRANLHAGERVQSRATVQSNDKAMEESAATMKELLQRISEMKDTMQASNMQRGSIAEQQSMQLQEVVAGLETVARKVAKIESK